MESTNEMTTITDGWVYVTDVTYCWTKYVLPRPPLIVYIYLL